MSDLVSDLFEARKNSRGVEASVAPQLQRTLVGSFTFTGPGLHTGGKTKIVEGATYRGWGLNYNIAFGKVVRPAPKTSAKDNPAK